MRALRHTFFTALLIYSAHAAAQTLTTLATFTSAPDGSDPSGLVIGSNGVLYGVTQSGGSKNNGTVFSLTPPKSTGGPWTESLLHNFTGGSDGGSPSGLAIGNGGVLYGTATYGGSYQSPSGCGVVFSLTPPALGASASWTYSVLYSFTGPDGCSSSTGLAIGSGSGGYPALFGTTQFGGTANTGTVFSLTPPTSPGGVWTEAALYSFPALSFNTSSINPSALVIGTGGVLYGATQYGGTGTANICLFLPGGCGTIFSLTPPAGAPSGPGGAWKLATLYNFTGYSDGAWPNGLVLGSGGVLYGSVSYGGVFSLTPPAGPQSGPGGAWTESALYGGSSAEVAIGAGGVIYAVTRSSPVSTSYSVVSLTASGGAWTPSTLYSFSATSASSLVIGQSGALFGTVSGGAAAAGEVYSVTPSAGSAGTWTPSVLHSFTGGTATGATVAGLAISGSGTLYGSTSGGGAGSCPGGCGTIFSMTPPASTGGNWTVSVLYMFAGGSDGAYPVGTLAIGSGPGGYPVLYGTTSYGGTGTCTLYGNPIPGCGTVFSLAPPVSPGGAWTESVLHSFTLPDAPCAVTSCVGGSDGAFPGAGVVRDSGGVLYGTTKVGGTGDCYFGCGTVYQLSPPLFPGGAWDEEILYNFIRTGIPFGPVFGSGAGATGLSIASGPGGYPVLYGAERFTGNSLTDESGACGTLFSLTPPANPGLAWTETDLYVFAADGSDGCGPTAGVAVGSDGLLYGTTSYSATYYGEVFSLTPPVSAGGAWTEAVLHNFTGAGGVVPNGVAIGSGGILYGTTQSGGSGQCSPPEFSGCGTVFALIPPMPPGGPWAEATLYNFTGGGDGAFPSTNVAIGTGPGGYPVLYGATQANPNSSTVFSLQPGSGLLPSINAGGVVNAASYTAPIAPGSIASAFGDYFVSSPLSASQSPLPTDISGLSLQFDDRTQAPLFFVSGRQVNFQVPWEMSGQSGTLTAAIDGQTGAAQALSLAPFAPAIFTTNASGSGQGAILDTSYRLVDSANPVAAGSYVLIYCTGLGAVGNQPATGSPAPSGPLAWSATPTVTIGGLAANVQFSGLAPGYVGLYQVNAQVPAGSATGSAVPVVISMNGVTSNTVTMAVE
jgi:uncharacterized protein (TIGR03437 family)